MDLKEIGILLLLLVMILIFGNLWFHFIEGIRNKINKLLPHRRETTAWHPLPAEEQQKEVCNE